MEVMRAVIATNVVGFLVGYDKAPRHSSVLDLGSHLLRPVASQLQVSSVHRPAMDSHHQGVVAP